ncbi:sodium/pantothenate symporter [Aquibacillus koreensis]|uniref:Sodium/pantothenate symporter n=1 Tax=Aquibacillus koreensis TaxID=279446 RepID=A0A9X3WLJ7_9BACI|nr:sodium/pantothenate symporter [Aquibacillus koreensis]MCT2536541.1 sodium/pantothenate symporter [Aquibacillus koreensis]MDC3419371.1 sodium/pantothenate symporter [Aquibacillus koreensis]
MNLPVIIPLLIFLLIIILIGLYAARFVKSTNTFLHEYFIGSRSLGGFILAMTMVATYGSGSSFLGGPGAAYSIGLAWVLLSMSQLVTGYFTLSILGKKFAIMSRKINAITLIDFLKERYRSKWVVILSAFSIVIFLFSAMAAQWVGGARLIESITGLSYTTAILIFSITLLLYVIFGGFRAVVITDAIQGVIMFVGTLVILIATIVAGGGISNIMAELVSENPNLITPYGADGSLTPLYISSFWILVGVGVVGLPQVAVRAMSYRDSKSLHKALIIGTVTVGIIMLGMHLTGVFGRAVLPGIEEADKVIPLLAMDVLPNWIAGILLAAPLAAIMSTVDSLLLVVSSSIVKDIYINYVKPDADEKRIRVLSGAVTTTVGVLVLFMAIDPPDLLIWLNLFAFGGLEAAFIWPIIMGLYWKKGNAYGALASIIIGVSSYILLYSVYTNPFGMHAVVIPVILSFLCYVSVSLLTQKVNAVEQKAIIQKLWSV